MEKQITVEAADKITTRPFVNEECGDTMWDAVLMEAEGRVQQAPALAPCKMEENCGGKGLC